MENDHDRLEKGVLHQESSNGLNRHAGNGEGTNGLEGGALARGQQQQNHQETLACLPQTQGWCPIGGANLQEQQAGWNNQATRSSVNNVDMEDARTLVAFSANAGSLPPCSVSQPSPNPTAQLYERFSQEMASRGDDAKQKGWCGESEPCTPEDLSKLQTALSQARHGHKPPNCDCEGPECPDYLEWLEKKIKMAADSQDKGLCKMSGVPQLQTQHYQSKPKTQPIGTSTSCGTDLQSQNTVKQPPVPRPYGPPPPIPCSPSVLSIAKERNVSLQTAIAIEALTQLSGTGGAVGESMSVNSHHQVSLQTPSQSQNGIQLVSSSSGPLKSSSVSPMPQSVSPGNFPQQDPTSWEQSQPQSQGPAHHSSQYGSSNSPFPNSRPATASPFPQQWQQGTGASCEKSSQRNPWMMLNSEPQARFPHPSLCGGGDPMSELKQLLGDTSGKYAKAAFKFPAPPHGLNDSHKAGHQVMPHVKQEVDHGDYPDQASCAAVGQYGMVNGQQQYQGQQFSQSIRHSTQAALQQHLHHKRNLFSNPQPFSPRVPTMCQTLRKWWPQTTAESSLDIKQEPKKKKNAQSSPHLKQPMSGLLGALGSPLPKPKQIIIKKPKQKASQPTFLPKSQITIQKPPPSLPVSMPSLPNFIPSLPGMEAGFPPCPPLYNPSQVAASQASPAQSQESIMNSSSIPISENNALAPNPMSVPVPPAQEGLTSSGLTEAGEGTLSTTSTLQTSASQPTPPLPGLSSLDPKFEELIRRFEEEFGDASPSIPVPGIPEQDPAPPVVTESQPNSNSGQARTQSPSTEELNKPLIAPTCQTKSMQEGYKERELDVNQDEAVEKEEAPMSSSLLPATKQEAEQCEIDVKPSGQLLSQAREVYLQQQQHRILVDPFTIPFSPPNKRVKIESSGGVTVLSTTGSFSTTGEDVDTPTKDGFPLAPSLKGFLESPMRYLDTPTKSLLDTPVKNNQSEFPTCNCVEQIVEKDEGPYYNHLGSGPSVASIRDLMESRSGEKGEAIRIEKVLFTGREGKSSQGCPIAKWVIRRSSEKEKLLCLVRHRAGHHCANAVIIILILCWEGVPRAIGDKLYREVSETLTKYGIPTSRRCGLNDDRTCACQGKDTELSGASFSFGCSWSMYFNGCKYARSKMPRKFRLQGEHPEEEELLRSNFQDLATRVAPVYEKLAPQAYSNQCAHEKVATDCRLGLQEGRPFSGITACMDFCAHAHKDQHNLHNGCTVVCTLTKEDNRQVGVIPDDEQLHVLPLYKVSLTDEFGSEENQRLKMQNGAIQVLSNFRREVRKLPEPAKSCRQRRLEAKKAASEKKIKKQQVSDTPEKTIKKEVHHIVSAHQQEGNKAIPKQEVKPTIKKQLVDHFQAVNGSLNGYAALGNGKMCPDPYGLSSACPSYPGPYARGALPSSTQPALHVNGFHPNLQGMPYTYYNYPSSALLPPELLGYEGRNSAWSKAAAVDQKPDVQNLQARVAQTYPNRSDQRQQVADLAGPGYPRRSELSASPAPPDRMRRVPPVVKQEPTEVPLFDSRPDGQVQSCPTTPSASPQPDGWRGHKPNGSLPSKAWDGNVRAVVAHPSFRPDKQRLQQQLHPTQAQHSSYPHPQRQWSPYPATSSPALSPSPSPHPATPHHWDGPAPSPQSEAWGPVGASSYGPTGLRQGTPVGAFPDKLLSQAVESRGSTPLGLQEKACKFGGASAAGSTPSPAPEGRLFPDALQKTDGQACWDSEVESHSEREAEEAEEEVWSDSEHNFLDPNIGGVAVAPAHGSILIECAKRELHATTPLKKPDRSHPTRISLVFYQHKNLNQPCHGLALWEAKMKMLAERAKQRQQEAALLGLSQEDIKAYGKKRKWADGAASPSSGATKDRRDGVVTRLAPTQHTTTMVTVSPYAFTQLTGPYSRFM
ncbi:methylcytosine dioxygenase TET3 [Electrophorus electricus]|uniref:Methylcytosine dioxygenase TET n=1 Tax=Electrophorus electricus TaxID=8005 RepID=A0A4W4EXN2_ELEEL|nr:methylcytosine dioxygenase TET3 [Electrophorus electricus]XP_035386264.1 methylcytosine dioxygenase TET3 [Electrophorus electricus]XP_035386265.1 methylcytosine dioxygenase TET3 [Electrophorus electricus]XP_035386266.1 methylcytosine dioxygenase TET3 [Electrophorus electricus]